jgi:hypothetical protein
MTKISGLRLVPRATAKLVLQKQLDRKMPKKSGLKTAVCQIKCICTTGSIGCSNSATARSDGCGAINLATACHFATSLFRSSLLGGRALRGLSGGIAAREYALAFPWCDACVANSLSNSGFWLVGQKLRIPRAKPSGLCFSPPIKKPAGRACLLAERAGFEPAEGLTPHTLSRRAT